MHEVFYPFLSLKQDGEVPAARGPRCLGERAGPARPAVQVRVGWSGKPGENWVVISRTHGKSPFLETAAL